MSKCSNSKSHKGFFKWFKSKKTNKSNKSNKSIESIESNESIETNEYVTNYNTNDMVNFIKHNTKTITLEQVAEYLDTYPETINQKSASCNTPLSFVLKYNRSINDSKNIITLLLGYTDIIITNELYVAIQCINDLAIIELLIQKIDYQQTYTTDVYQHAIISKSNEIEKINLLIDYNFNIDNNAVYLAIKNKKIECVKLLLNNITENLTYNTVSTSVKYYDKNIFELVVKHINIETLDFDPYNIPTNLIIDIPNSLKIDLVIITNVLKAFYSRGIKPKISQSYKVEDTDTTFSIIYKNLFGKSQFETKDELTKIVLQRYIIK
jgi:hypothetical protein